VNASNAKDYLTLVQALADGKVIQIRTHDGQWVDLGTTVHFGDVPSEYRIKPEPREIWVNRKDGYDSERHFHCEAEAKEFANPGATQHRYREVLE
jgi:hypothetical protein